MNELQEALGISGKQKIFTKTIQKPKYYNKVKDNTLLKENYNFMADLLFLPKTKKGFQYLFVIVDLATDEFDYEPLKEKSSSEIVKAIYSIDKRPYIKINFDRGQSIRTDSGKEFEGSFGKWMYQHSILHRIAQPNRHIQVANVERLNGILGTLFNGYMNSIEEKTGKPYKEWTDKLDFIREKLNKIRKKKLPDNIFTYIYPEWNAFKVLFNKKYVKKKETETEPRYEEIKPKYKVGDLVYVVLETPEDALGNKQPGLFRNGDYRLTKEPHKITKLLYYHGPPYYRYIVSTFKGVSYQEAELKPAIGETDEKFKVKKIIGKKKIKKVLHYLVWFKGETKKEASWQPAQNLIDDGLQDYIDDYNENN
jgi:hypothetical protein